MKKTKTKCIESINAINTKKWVRVKRTITIHPELDEMIKADAKKSNRSSSAIIEIIINNHYTKRSDKDELKKTKKT